ncbi:MAG TPA: AtpZ/AtpI family protein [Bacteroidales bacterium]|nr:AtpZ/AtpI family protein [Bacteroidales bacterium]
MVTQQEPQKKKDLKKRPGKGLNDWAKYSGMAFQMFAIIFITTWGGIKLDKITGNNKPVFTIILSLLGVVAAIYNVLKDFIRKDN